MVASLNRSELIGNLGADPETRGAVVRMRIATNERVKGEGDTWKDHTEWHNVVAFGKLGETCARYLKKGAKVYVEGKMRTSRYTDKDGVERYSTEIRADNVLFLDSRREAEAEDPAEPGDGIPF